MSHIPESVWLMLATIGIWIGTGIGLAFKADHAIVVGATTATFFIWFFGKGYSVSKFFDG